MARVNYGYKGTTLTLAQAIEAGAPVSTQEYRHVVQLGGITPLLPPSAPTSLSATPADSQVSLSWAAPSSNGGSAVTGYQVQYLDDSSSLVTLSVGGTSTTITGLTNGTSYSFSVSAINEYGAGAAATVSSTPVALLASGWLVVAGGGGGGGFRGGGGGAGGCIFATGNLPKGVPISVVIGAGGAGSDTNPDGWEGVNGSNSSLGGIIALGGGWGARGLGWLHGLLVDGTYNYAKADGGAGGSGGGGSGGPAPYYGGGGLGTSGQGYRGGRGESGNWTYMGGGGGGAYDAGGIDQDGNFGPGRAGLGLGSASDWLDVFSAGEYTSSFYSYPYGQMAAGRYIAGGGGGGTYQTSANIGGKGGGGAGGETNQAGTAGLQSTGGGGGGGGNGQNGAAGGSGLVIIRYPASQGAATATTGSPSTAVSGGYRYYMFAGSGSITI